MFRLFIGVVLCGVLAAFNIGCESMGSSMPFTSKSYPAKGQVLRLDPALDEILAPNAKLERLVGEFDWSEGPVWMKSTNSLLFSDVPQNTIYRWNEKDGLSVFSWQSGYTGATVRGGEMGTNGLTVDSQGRLVSCEHGDRRVARWNPDGTKTTLADKWDGKRLNSPNDLVYDSKGNLYFTDPPYGLEGPNRDQGKELAFQGVYRVGADGKMTLLTQDMTKPNGIALSPDEKTLYVANSDPQKALWMAYDLKEDGTIANGRVFFDATSMVAGRKGLPDGMKVDEAGNVWATGPGGVLIFSPLGKHLGTIETGEATGNCAWGGDGSTLYVMADMWLCKIRTKTKGPGW